MLCWADLRTLQSCRATLPPELLDPEQNAVTLANQHYLHWHMFEIHN